MRQEVVIVIAEDDEGHATLIRKNLKRSGILNEMLHFSDGQQTLDFFFMKGKGRKRKRGSSYLLLLDIRMPKVDGVEVLKRIKAEPELSKVPVIMITTTDDPMEVSRCHSLGCSSYITKPVDYEKFVDAINKLELFEVPTINGDE